MIYTISKLIGKALGYQDEQIEDVLSKLDRDKAFLVLEDDPLFGAINWWISSKNNEEEFVPASTLHTGMKGRPGFENRYRSVVSLGKRLRNIQAELKLYFGMESQMNPSTKIWEYKFPKNQMKRNEDDNKFDEVKKC